MCVFVSMHVREKDSGERGRTWSTKWRQTALLSFSGGSACIVIITSAFRWSTLTSNLLIFCGWLVWCHSPWCQNFQKIQNNECNVVSVKHRNKILMLPYMLLSVVFIKPVVHVNQTLSLIHGLLGKRLNRWPIKTLLHIHPSLCDSLNTRKH